MRLVRLICFLMFAGASQLTMAQAQYDQTTPFQERTKVQLYPNPTDPNTEYLVVKLEQIPAEKVNVAVHNIIGNRVEVETEVVGEHELWVKVKDLASGYYLLALKDEGDSKFRGTYKFLKR